MNEYFPLKGPARRPTPKRKHKLQMHSLRKEQIRALNADYGEFRLENRMGYISQHSPRGEDAAGRRQPSMINEDLLIIGNVKSPGRLHINGEVQRAVQCDSLLLGERASLLGDVTAEEVIVDGT